MRTAFLVALLAVSAGLAADIWLTLRPPIAASGEPVAEPRPLPAAPTRAAQEDAGQSTASVEAILARPLFSADRRPKQAAPAQAAAPAAPAALPRMSGIMVNGASRAAIFAGANGKPAVIAEGGRIGPFTVQSIEPQQVTITGPGGKRVVRTSFDPNPAAAPAPQAVPGLALDGPMLGVSR